MLDSKKYFELINDEQVKYAILLIENGYARIMDNEVWDTDTVFYPEFMINKSENYIKDPLGKYYPMVKKIDVLIKVELPCELEDVKEIIEHHKEMEEICRIEMSESMLEDMYVDYLCCECV